MVSLSVRLFFCQSIHFYYANTSDKMTHVHHLPNRICPSSYIIVKFFFCLYPFQSLYMIIVVGIEENLHWLSRETQC